VLNLFILIMEIMKKEISMNYVHLIQHLLVYLLKQFVQHLRFVFIFTNKFIFLLTMFSYYQSMGIITVHGQKKRVLNFMKIRLLNHLMCVLLHNQPYNGIYQKIRINYLLFLSLGQCILFNLQLMNIQ
jgi:hypothetical protein